MQICPILFFKIGQEMCEHAGNFHIISVNSWKIRENEWMFCDINSLPETKYLHIALSLMYVA